MSGSEERPPSCWEVMGCGREPDGAKAQTHGVCPSAIAWDQTGLNRGEAGGRACWLVSGSLARGRFAGTCTVMGPDGCLGCSFFHAVRLEEGQDFAMWPERPVEANGRTRFRGWE